MPDDFDATEVIRMILNDNCHQAIIDLARLLEKAEIDPSDSLDNVTAKLKYTLNQLTVADISFCVLAMSVNKDEIIVFRLACESE